MKVTRFKYWKMNESIKDSHLNKILDKISSGSKLTEKEKDFLKNFNNVSDDDLIDRKYLKLSTTYELIRDLLEHNKKIMCDLYDRDGKISLLIKSVKMNFEAEECILTFKNDTTHKIKDNWLYNIIYNIDNDIYSLESQDEYYEKITIS